VLWSYEDEAWSNCEVQNPKIGPCATRALPRLLGLGNMALKVAKMAPSTRKWGDRWTILLTNLARCVWKVEGGVSRWLVGVVGLGGGPAPAPTGGARRFGRFFNSSG
jgi:hypothetical protein